MSIFKQPCTALGPTFYKLHVTPPAHALKNYMFHPNMKRSHFQTRKHNKKSKISLKTPRYGPPEIYYGPHSELVGITCSL